ncbi:MAG: sodium ion-translocating decarboxylase subunit beta, partial [Treponema sp.]|nr:sodium ion-translocating decarboxylase subunit beta [Treponema sp.]
MLGRKTDPIWVLKACMILIIGAFLFSAVSASFAPRAAAQAAPASVDELPSFRNMDGIIPNSRDLPQVNFVSIVEGIVRTTGIYAFINTITNGVTPAGQPITILGWQELLMVIVGFVVVYLGAVKGFEPILLVPIGFGIIFVNIPGAGMGDPGIWNEELHIFEHQGFLNLIYNAGVGNEFFPLLIFVGIGAMTDFGPLIA